MQRAIRGLSKRFPHIMDDLKPLLDNLKAGENPGDALPGFHAASRKSAFSPPSNVEANVEDFVLFIRVVPDSSL